MWILQQLPCKSGKKRTILTPLMLEILVHLDMKHLNRAYWYSEISLMCLFSRSCHRWGSGWLYSRSEDVSSAKQRSPDAVKTFYCFIPVVAESKWNHQFSGVSGGLISHSYLKTTVALRSNDHGSYLTPITVSIWAWPEEERFSNHLLCLFFLL